MSQRLTDALLLYLSAEFGLPPGTVSWVITCFTIGYAACQLFFGPVGDFVAAVGVLSTALNFVREKRRHIRQAHIA